MKAVIIAGGMGTRLRPLTNNIPKPIVPVMLKPFLEHQIELLVSHDIKEIILNLHYLSHEIKKAIGDGSRWGAKIYYSIEETPLGTAGAVKNAEQFFDDEPMVVFNGDVLTDLNLSQVINFHHEKKAKVTLTLTEVDDPTAFGLVLRDKNDRVTAFLEKPSWDMITCKTINAGTYVVDPKIFAKVPKDQPYSFERQLYPGLLAAKEPIYGYLPEKAYWLDIGNPEKYKEAHWAILRGDVAVKIAAAKVDGKIWLAKDTEPEPTAKILGPAIIGSKVKIGQGSALDEYVVVEDNVVIGRNCKIERTIIWQGAKIGSQVYLSDCIIGRNCVIEDHVIIGPGVVLADNSIVKRGTRLV